MYKLQYLLLIPVVYYYINTDNVTSSGITRFWFCFTDHSMNTQPWLLIRTKYVRRDTNSLQKNKFRELGTSGTRDLVPPTILTS